MKITQDVRDYAAQKKLDDEAAVAAGMAEQSEKFAETGAELYQPA